MSEILSYITGKLSLIGGVSLLAFLIMYFAEPSLFYKDGKPRVFILNSVTIAILVAVLASVGVYYQTMWQMRGLATAVVMSGAI